MNALARKTLKPKALIGVIFCILILASIAYAAQGDYSPERNGITTQSHPYGLSYNDFNSFTDNYTLCYMRYWSDRADDKNCNKDYQDERDFLVAGNISDSDDRYYHTLNSANIGDTVRIMFYYHNNAEETRDNKYTAKDVTAYINYTDADSPQGRLYCSNCNNKNIYDLATINASKQFKLEYIPNSIQIVSKDLAGDGKILKLKDTDSRLKFTENEIRFSDGDVPGCNPHDRYIYFDFKIVEFEEEESECSSLELTPSSANIEDFFDRSGDPVDSVTFGLKNVKPSDFDGNFNWKGENGGSFSAPGPFELTQITTDSKSDTVNFYADREGAKLTVQSSEFPNCTDYVTVDGRCGDGHVWEGKEDCDDGNSVETDECNSQCEQTFCGDYIVQKPNGKGTGGPRNDGYEECDDGPNGSATCTAQCTIIEEVPECDSININNSEVLAIIETQVSVTVKPSDYTPALTWVASEDSGEFEGENPYFSGSDTSVSFEKGAIGEIVYVYDKNDVSCADQITVTGCEDLSVSPTSIDLNRDTLPVTITLVTDPSTWNREMIFTSTDTTATFDGKPSGYRTTNRKVLYTGTKEANIEIVDATGLYTNPTSEFPYDCTAKISVTKEKTFCGDETVQKPNDDGFYEECDDGNSSSSDQCTSSCEFTYCGDNIVQKPNGEKKGGPKDDGYEECDAGPKGSETCTTRCTIIEEIPECDSININNSEVLAIIETQVSVTVKPSDYTPALTWVASEDSGEFEGENPYFSGSDTSVSFENGAIGEIVYVYDKNDVSCADQITVTGCKDLSVSPTSIDLDRDTLPVTITLITDPSTWNREMIFTSTDTTATFDGKLSGYRTTNRKVLYTGTKEANIEIVDATGLYTNPTSEFPYDCTAKISVTKEKTYCGDKIVQKPNDDGFYEECDGESYCSDTCTIVEELVCESLTFVKEDFTEDQVSDGKKITLEVNPEPDTYPDDVSWQCTGNGKFIVNVTEYPCNNNQIYNFDVTKVEYTGGKENDIITTFDENFQSICRDSFKIGPAVTPPQPFCGDGQVDSGEQCDDGNKTSGDGCDATCKTEGGGAPFCGDGNVDSGEQCDDGNNISGDGCDSNCNTEGGGPPGGGSCEIDIKTEDGFVLYDGSSYPEKISLSDIGIPLNFQIENSGAEPYYLESKNKHSGNFSGIFTAYEQKWDSEADEIGNPLDSSKHYFTLANPSGENVSRYENIEVGTVVTIRSMDEDCAAQFEFIEEGEEVPTGDEEVCIDLKASVDEFNANTRLPLMVELTPNPSTFEGKYNWTTTIEDISFNGSVKEYESVDRTVTLENSTGEDKFGTSGNINIKSVDYPEDCRVDIPVSDNDALVKGLICPRTQSNIASDGDIVDYAIIYYFEPTRSVSWVNIWDSIGQPSGIPGSLGENDHVEMYSTPMIELVKASGTKITLTTCDEGMTNICYEGRLDEAEGITIKNLKNDSELDVKNDYIKISYSGKLHADKDLKCNEETTDECQAEYFLNEAKSYTDTGLAHTSYSTVWAICPFLIAENTGDVFFEDSLGVGTDLSCIDPSLKNTTGLAVQEYTSMIPKGAMGSPIIPEIFNCESTGPDVIGRFSSFVCEIETVVDEQWKQTKIETRILENAIQSTRYFEERESSAALDNLSINGLDTVIGSQSDNNPSHIYRVSGDLDIKNNYDTRINITDDGARTVIVEGDLSIFSNLEYDPTASKDYKKIPSIAFIVMGNIYIHPDVETLVGVFYTQNDFKSVGDADSNKTLTIKGSVYGDIEPLFKKRTGFGDPNRNEGAITILYDERILLNTPPGLKDFVDINQTEVAR